jgi:RNA polymerase sigma-70 factor (ECF subfamily)
MAALAGWQGTGDDPDDGAMVLRALGGDRDAFGVLVQRYQRLVFRIVGGFLANRADVEEVAQETFLRAFAGLSGFKLGSPFGPWIARIATHASYDRLRRRQRGSEVAWEDLSPDEQRAAQTLATGGEPADRAATRDVLERAVASLGPKDRQALILADAQGLTPAEVGAVLGCSPLAARIRLHRARRAMRRVVEKLVSGMNPAR